MIPRIPGSSDPLRCLTCSTTGRHTSDMLHVQQSIEATDLCPRCAEKEADRLIREVEDAAQTLARLQERPATTALLDIVLELRHLEVA